MAAVLVNGHSLHVTDDYVSQASTPASPAASFIIQQGSTTLPSINLSGPAYADYHSQPPTPTSVRSDISLDPPPGMSFADFLRTWSDDVVAEWLASIKCTHQALVFKTNDIRGDVLLELDQFTLKEMGIVSVGDRIRIVAAVKKLRQRSAASHAAYARSSVHDRTPTAADHARRGSGASDRSFVSVPAPPPPAAHASSAPGRRLDSARPAPLHLTNAVTDGLPRLIRDGQDSARSVAPIRPLPQPNSNTTPALSTATARAIPPPPRGQPPVPNARTPRTHLIPPTTLTGRRTPTLPEPPAFNTNQPLPNPPASIGGLHQQPSSDGRQTPSGARPLRTQSPLGQLPNRNITRSPGEHGRNHSGSGAGITSSKPSPSRPPPSSAAANAHPYAQSGPALQNGLSPISETSFSSQRTHSPPTAASNPNVTPHRSGSVVRPNTPSHAPSLDDIRRKVVKFSMPEEGKSSMIQVLDCGSGAEIMERALKKLKGVYDGPTRVEIVDGGLNVDGWAVFLDESQRIPLTEEKLMSICQAPPDQPAREHGLTLRNIKRGKASPTSPRFTAFPKASGSTETLDELLLAPEIRAPPTPGTKAYKRASSVSILSGLGVRIPDAPPSASSASLATQDSPTKSPGTGPEKKGKLRNFFGQRPPSELITTHLAEYFPFTEKKVLERTRRQSMMRNSSSAGGIAGAGAGGMGLVGRRDSIISWNPPARSHSRFSVSTLGSQRSARNSMASGFSYTAPLPPAADEPPPPLPVAPPRVSVSADDVDEAEPADETASEREARLSRRMSRPHLLPPVAFPSESLAESLNLTSNGGGSRPGSRLSTASSKRMSYITELRSRRDRSDTASMLTVDEITAEVESRRESMDVQSGEETDDWTAVESSEADTRSLKEMPEEETEEDEDEESDDEDVDDDATDVTVTDDEEPGKAITSRGDRTIKWIKGALIGAGSFGKVYLGMDAATGLLMAVKQVELPSGSANDERKKSMLSALEHEIELLKDFHHENIVQYHSSSAEDDHLNIFLEYVPGGSVTSLLRNYGAFEEPLVRNWVRQILQGLNYLHERDIIHRDIKGANMLVDNKGGIKISDFGISKKIDENLMKEGNRAHRPSLQGSVFWMAPEVVKQTAYTQKADIWSVGCLVVEMLTGEHPYPQLSQMQAIFKIGMSSKPTIPADISSEAENFLQKTFELNHETRPSAAELLKHPWIVNSPLPLGA